MNKIKQFKNFIKNLYEQWYQDIQSQYKINDTIKTEYQKGYEDGIKDLMMATADYLIRQQKEKE